MRKFCFIIFFIGSFVFVSHTSAQQSIKAFPTAEGYGVNTIGGRGGRVIEVTNLNDAGTGSLRGCAEATGPRICVFRVSGTIELTNQISIYQANSYLTIAGQTSPGGVQLHGYKLASTLHISEGAHDVVIRHMRVRPGGPALRSNTGQGITIYASGGLPVYNIILDHNSIEWCTDDCTGTYSGITAGSVVRDVTIQWNLIAESVVDRPVDSTGFLLSFGGYQPTATVSVHHNLVAHGVGRLPKVGRMGMVDFRNNVVYNWGSASEYGYGGDHALEGWGGYTIDGEVGAGASAFGNFVNNHYIAGPNSIANGHVFRLGNGGPVRPDGHTAERGGTKIYTEGNWSSNCPTGCANDWNNKFWNNDYISFNGTEPLATETQYRASNPFAAPAVATDPSNTVKAKVLATVGASRPSRDTADSKIVNDVIYLTGNIGDIGMGGPWPTLTGPVAPTDTDHDGMPDAWESSHGLNASSASDGSAVAANGYTNVENYLNELAGDPIPGGSVTPSPTPTPDPATTFYVATTGSDTNAGTITAPFKTIAKGLTVMGPGKTLYVRGGTYDEGTIQTIPNGTSWTAAVTISAYNSETVTLRPTNTAVPIIYHGGDQYQIISGLILDGGALTSSYSNGVHIDASHHIRYQNCEIKDVYTNGFLVSDTSHHNEFIDLNVHGAGIRDVNYGPGHNAFYISGDNNLVEKSEIWNSQGGIMSWASAAGTTADYNVFRNNIVHDVGIPGTNRSIGIGLANGTGGMVYNNIVYKNNKGIYALINHSGGKIYNNTVHDNWAFGIGVDNTSPSTIIRNNITFQNENGQNIVYPSGTTLSNNLSTDPKFVNPTAFDFHLQSSSPAINAGVTLSEVTGDFEGTPRPQGSAYDIGADEYGAGSTSPTPTPVPQGCVNPTPIPSGFSSPCPVFSVSPQSGSLSQSISVSITPDASRTVWIYKTMYITEGNAWKSITLPGTIQYTYWLQGNVSYTLYPLPLTLSAGVHYLASWDWTWDAANQCYKGPGATACGGGQYRIQMITIR